LYSRTVAANEKEIPGRKKPTHANTYTNLWVGRNPVTVHCICNFFPFSWNFKKLKLLHCRDRVSCRIALKAVAHQCHGVSGQYAMGTLGYTFPQKNNTEESACISSLSKIASAALLHCA